MSQGWCNLHTLVLLACVLVLAVSIIVIADSGYSPPYCPPYCPPYQPPGMPPGLVECCLCLKDETPPTITALSLPLPTIYGWNNTDVLVTLRAEDEEAGCGVDAIFYILDGQGVTVPGDQLDWVEAGRVARYRFTVNPEGIHRLEYWARDLAGNESKHGTLVISIDKTPPTISSNRFPEPNRNGWNNTAVFVWFDCEDSLSGVASCEGYQMVRKEGIGQSVTGEAVDKAGNYASTTVSDINIDRTPPSLQLLPPGGTYADSVTVVWEALDGLSGLDQCLVYLNGSLISSDPVGTHTLGQGFRHVELFARDRADNGSTVAERYRVGRVDCLQVIALSVFPCESNTPAVISCKIKNVGRTHETQTIHLRIDGSLQDSQSLTLAPGASRTIHLSYVFPKSGSYSVTVSSEDDSKTITLQVSPPL